MEAFGLAPSAQLPQGSPVHGCRGCGGVWIETAVLDRLLAAAAAHAVADGRPVRPAQVKGRTMASTKVVYRKCAVCSDHMQRRNFARVSGIVVDQCRHHGTFFDAGELEDVIAFVRSGGLRLAAERDAQEREREAKHRISMSAPIGSMGMSSTADAHWALESQRGVDPIGAFMRWGVRWITGR